MLPANVNSICVIILTVLYYPYSAHAICHQMPNASDVSVDRIFGKYGVVKYVGSRNVTVINTTGLNDLLKTLSLDKVHVVCEEDDKECKKDRLHMRKRAKDPLSKRKRRSVTPDHDKDEDHDKDMEQQNKSCMEVKRKIKSDFGIEPDTGILKKQFVNVCPFLVDNIVNKACIHYHKRYPAFVHPDELPTTGQKWGYGVIAITVCSLLSLVVIAMIPCLQKSFYDQLMAYLVALAVGTLCGDALLHLIPHAFIEGANLAAGIEVSEEQAEKQHYSQVYRALVVMAGIYLFFIVEQLMRIKGSMSKRHESTSDDVQMIDPVGNEETKHGHEDEHEHKEDVLIEPSGAHTHSPSGHAHSHGDKNITGETNISSVAWMVVVGDGFHNFSDGLAVGAAFSASVSSGVSTTIAIFCHELPHELGDFAILLKAGMTARQAITYNLVGAILSYFGLAIGILAGTNDLGRHVILCLTAGLFLYISLVNMMAEVAGTETDVFKCRTVLCQHVGMLSGIGIMLVISLYEHDM